MYVTVKLSSGFGNQLFQVAAMLGYADKWGHTPVFVEPPPISQEHPNTAFRMDRLFPDIPLLSTEAVTAAANPWKLLREHPSNAFTYVPLPQVDGNVYLEGYFQSEKYFPTAGISLPPLKSPVVCQVDFFLNDWTRVFFLHVRRGDFLHPNNAHHCVDLTAYTDRCLRQFRDAYGPNVQCLVVSDDMAWCRAHLPQQHPWWPATAWIWCPEEATDQETFFWMTVCERGGICANSTFSWWAAYFLHRSHTSNTALFCMPDTWGHPPAMPPARDIYPAWATVVSVHKDIPVEPS